MPAGLDLRTAFGRSVRCYREKPAVVTPAGEETTYAALDRRSTALANALADRLPGERCAVLLHNAPETIECMVAGPKRGVGMVQLPFRAGVDELVSDMSLAEAEGLIFDDANADLAERVLDRMDLSTAIHVGETDIDRAGVEPYEAVVADAATGLDDRLPAGDEYGVFFTSGTTGQPKAVPFDGEQLQMGSAQVIMEMGIEPTDVALVSTPWYHMVTTDAWILPHLQAGATMVVQEAFDPPETLRLIQDHDVTGLLAVPTQLTALNDTQEREGFDVGTLSYIRTGGSVVKGDLVDRTADHLSENVFNTYGQTEGGPNLTFAHPSDQADHPRTIGKESYVWELRVVEAVDPDEDPDPGAVVDPGGTGEILARRPKMPEGYLGDVGEDPFVDGWLRTGDVAEVDEDGFLYIVDRVDNMIISGGENVYPQEVEQALENHESVEEAAVVGLDDDYWGEVVAAVVRAADGVDEDELEEFCLAHDGLADFKRPRRYAFADDPLPRTDTGTLKRPDAAERYFSEE